MSDSGKHIEGPTSETSPYDEEPSDPGPDDLTALLDSLATQYEIELPKIQTATEDDPLEDATANVANPDESIFVPLVSAKSDEAKAFRGLEFAWAQLITEHEGKKSVLPTHPMKRWTGANLSFTIIDSPLRRGIKLSIVVENPKDTRKLPPDLRAEAWFFFGDSIKKGKQIENLTIEEILKPDYRPPSDPTLTQLMDVDAGVAPLPPSGPVDDDIAAIDLQWTSSGATAVLFNRYKPEWTQETKDLVSFGENLRNGGAVHVRLPVNTREKRNKLPELRKLVAWAPTGPIPKDCFAPPPFYPYHKNSGHVEVSFNCMINAETLSSSTRSPFTPIPIPAELYFIDPREAEVKLGYGAHYEAEYQQEILKIVSDSVHRIGFITLGDDRDFIQFVTIQINKSMIPSRYGENYQIRAEEIKIAAVRIDGFEEETFELRVMIIDNVLDLNLGDGDVLGVVQGRHVPRDTFKEVASVQPQAPHKFFPGKIIARKNDASIKRQLDAVHQICSIERGAKTLCGKFDRWWPILLNHSARHPKVEVIPDCDKKVLAEAQSWAKKQLRHREQMNVIDAANNVHGSVGLVSGPPGTGKTLTAVHLSVVYWRTGGHVVYLAPTQQSCDHALSVLKTVAPEIPVLRLYRAHHEEGEYRTAASGSTDEVDIDNQILEMSIIMAMRKDRRDKVFGHSKYSLARAVIDRALSCRDGKVMVEYKPRGSPAKEPGEPLDLWATIRRYTTLLEDPENPYHTWSPEDKVKYGFCCKHGSDEVMRDARFIIVTANNAGAKIITKNFGLESKYIAVICDEAAMIMEPDQWVAITKLNAQDKITVMWLIGDHKQLVPLIISKYAAINPFAWQLEYSLYARLVVAGHAHYELRLSGRMHREILRFPNKRSYGGRLEATNAANNRELPKNYIGWYKTYFGQQSDDGCRLYALFVDGVCNVVPRTGSKYNIENAATIVHMLNSIREAEAFPVNEMVVLTMYNRQKVIISALLKVLSAKLNIRRTAFPEVFTADSFHSRERTMVILDSTVTDELGFVDNENRMTMACTRAKDVFVLVGSRMTMAKSRGNEKGKQVTLEDHTVQHRRFSDVDGVRYFHSSPYLADYLSYLSKKDRVYEPMNSYADLRKVLALAPNNIMRL